MKPEGEKLRSMTEGERGSFRVASGGSFVADLRWSDLLSIDKARTEPREALRGFGAREGRTER